MIQELSQERLKFIQTLSILNPEDDWPQHPNDSRITELLKELRPLEEQVQDDLEQAWEIAQVNGNDDDSLRDFMHNYAYNQGLVFEYGNFWKPSSC